MALSIGIDLGGTKISGVLMNEKGAMLNKFSHPTEANKGRKQVINNILSVIFKLRTNQVVGIGIATPGFALPDGKITCSPNIPSLNGYNLGTELSKRTGLKVRLTNDANCFALAEAIGGAGIGKKNVVGVIIGTGVGSGIIIEGRIYNGSIGGAGEIGHTKILVDSKILEVEDLISGPNLRRRYNALSGENIASLKYADKKSPAWKKMYGEFLLYAGIFFANIMNTLDPDLIVVGGGVSNIDFYKDVKKVADKYAVEAIAKNCKIVRNKLGDDAGVLGAARLGFG